MRALIALAIVATLAGGARGDEYQRGRRKQRAAIALFVIGSAAIVASGPFFALSSGYNCPAVAVPPCDASQLVYFGIAFLVGGAAAHGIGMPLYISGSNDIDRYRQGAPPPLPPLATVRF